MPPIPPRRRGGQPSNHNARKHGLFAYKNPTALTNLSNLIRSSQPGPESLPDLLSQAIPSLRELIALLSKSSQGITSIRTVLARHRSIIHLLGLFLSIKKSLHRHQQLLLDLQFTASHALGHIYWNFHSLGVMRDADSFRENNKKSDFNSFLLFMQQGWQVSRRILREEKLHDRRRSLLYPQKRYVFPIP